jgi:SAM-dependent methyltransferase
MDNKKYLDSNRDLWDQLVPIHKRSEFYGVDAFRAGRSTLHDIEHQELGQVAGKKLLHLQCHFGLDSLSWARTGAEVTGVDFSPDAIDLARSISAETGIAAEFVCCNIYDLKNHLTGEFDIVFTSGGVLAWLPDLKRWAEIASHFVKPGGVFYIREFHPFTGIFDDENEIAEPTVHYPYFHSDKPMRFEDEGSYADRNADIRNVSYEWTHSLSDVINSLIEAGLRIEFVHEFPFNSYQSHPFLEQGSDGMWRYPKRPESLPLMFSIKAVK